VAGYARSPAGAAGPAGRQLVDAPAWCRVRLISFPRPRQPDIERQPPPRPGPPRTLRLLGRTGGGRTSAGGWVRRRGARDRACRPSRSATTRSSWSARAGGVCWPSGPPLDLSARSPKHPLVGSGQGAPRCTAGSRATWKGVRPVGPVTATRRRRQTSAPSSSFAAAGGRAGRRNAPRRLNPGDPLEMCALLDPWARRPLHLCWGRPWVAVRRRPSRKLARHVRQAARSG